MVPGTDTQGVRSPLPSRRWIVVTSIQPPTEALHRIARLCQNGWSAVVVGDTKSPPRWELEGVAYLSVEQQREMFGGLADLIPYAHYARKNLGYLYALAAGADLILETDDDNLPYPSFGADVTRTVTGRQVEGPGWVNVYRYFTDATIWPRGLPLDEIHSTGRLVAEDVTADCPVQQFLADGDPDVDAIYRLVFPGELNFDRTASPVILAERAWVPFNSQNTLFYADAFPLMYLPSHVSFRMTDIWRSFVAQAALWQDGKRLAFHPATVAQVRNPHDVMRDFSDEVAGYLNNQSFRVTLERAASRESGGGADLASRTIRLWEALVEADLIPPAELPIVSEWMARCAELVAERPPDGRYRHAEEGVGS